MTIAVGRRGEKNAPALCNTVDPLLRTSTPKEAFICNSQYMASCAEVANSVSSEFGERGCEVLDLTTRPDLNGKTCVVVLASEVSVQDQIRGPGQSQAPQQAPGDRGYRISYENDEIVRRDFASREECQAFVASLPNGEEWDRTGAICRATLLPGHLVQTEIYRTFDFTSLRTMISSEQTEGMTTLVTSTPACTR